MIWFSLALMIDDIANAAVAPQIAVAEEIKYINFLSKLNNSLSINQKKSDYHKDTYYRKVIS